MEDDLGITGTALDWFILYLSDRSWSVTVMNVESAQNDLHRGLPQGSVLGPVLFTLYTQPLSNIAKKLRRSFFLFRTMAEFIPLLDDVEIGVDDIDDLDHHILRIEDERRERREKQLQQNNLHLDIPPLPAGKSHHLFVSHSNRSEEETTWARNLVASLEEDCGLSCCWPERDFKPGKQVGKEIQSGILGAMKVVIVLSPDSVESRWCMYETEFAFHQSVNEPENLIIPVLFRPCEVPDLLKTMNYIDVPKGEDVVFKIRRCFDEDSRDMTVLHPAVKRFTKIKDDPKSGNFVEINASRNMKYICKGPAWSFKELTKHERYMLRKLGSKFSERVYFEARNIANKSPALKYFSITNLPKHCCTFCCGLSVVIMLLISFIMVCFELISRSIINGTIECFVLFPGIGILVPVCMCVVDKLNARRLKRQLIRYSLQNVLETNILVYYFDFFRGTPDLVFAFYDLQPCLKYLTRIIMERNNNIEEGEGVAEQTAKDYIFGLIVANMPRMVKGELPLSVVNRHPTHFRQKCLCEIIQEQLWETEVV